MLNFISSMCTTEANSGWPRVAWARLQAAVTCDEFWSSQKSGQKAQSLTKHEIRNEIPASGEQPKAPPFRSLSALGASVHHTLGSCHDRVSNPTPDVRKSPVLSRPPTPAGSSRRAQSVSVSFCHSPDRQTQKQTTEELLAPPREAACIKKT